MSDMFTMAVLWDQWCPRIANRIIIDMMTLQRLFRVKRVDFQVAAPLEMQVPLQALGIAYSQDFSASTACRIYILEGREIPEAVINAVPQDLEYDVLYLNPQDTTVPGLVHDDQDPYGRFPLPYPGKPIPPTMQPRYYRQKRITEPLMAPFI